MPSRKIVTTPKVLALAIGTALLHPNTILAAEQPQEIAVIGVAPGSTTGQQALRMPFAVKSSNFADLESQQSLDLSDYLNARSAGVNINSAQGNPLQADLQFRGFTASPLLGLPQGIAVYQDGVRINEPLGDAVNWDLLPESAIYSMDLISGANPVFGLNTLGGALVLRTKDGFNFPHTQAEVLTGSWGRQTLSVESGHALSLNDDSELAWYLNASLFDEEGWRQLSDSDSNNVLARLDWRSAASSLGLSYQQGDSDLIGNGALPIGMLALDRSAIFTAPDITENNLEAWTLYGSHQLSPGLQLSATVFQRENHTRSFNGDGSEFELCEYAGGARALFEEADDIEDALESLLDIELDDICAGEDPAITSTALLEAYIAQAALAAGLDADDFAIEDISDELYGSGVLSDQAINNISERRQKSSGLSLQAALDSPLLGRSNQLVLGASWYDGQARFSSITELAFLDPLTRSTRGLGTGTFVKAGETDVDTSRETWSVYFVNTHDLSESLVLSLAGRYNSSNIRLRDRSGERPELNGSHHFARFNPSLGLSWNVSSELNLYASWSESNRVPTPIELACNEGVFELARQYAAEAGDDPEDIDFECRLPNAFLADPPLDDVVTQSIEAGARGSFQGLRWHAGLFHATNRDDILFQTTGRATGLFANVDKTRRMGFESSVQGTYGKLDWQANWTWLQATFEDDFQVLSPNHPQADADGELAVQAGDRIPGLPEHLLKLSADYQLQPTLSLGAELLYNSSQVLRGDESNELAELGSYALVNLRLSWQPTPQLALFARVSNVFDRDYENFGILGEDPGEIISLADERPLFVGVGAPRAAWLGLRYRF